MFGKKGNILGLLLSAVCLYLVFQKVDMDRLWASLASLNYGFLAAALAVFLTTFLVRTTRWQSLLSPTKEVPYRRLFSVIFIGYMANNVLPARLGELVRAYVLSKKEGVRKSTTLATIFIERIFDGLSLLFILGAFMLAYETGAITLDAPLPGWVTKAGLFAGAGFLGAFGFVLTLEFFPKSADWARGLIQKFAPAKIAGKLEGILGAFVEGVSCLRSFPRLLFVFGASLLIWGIEGTTYFLLGEAFGMQLPIHVFLVTMVLVNLGTIIPSAPGFVGSFQLFCVMALGLFGVSKEVGLSYGLVLNMGEYLPVTLLGIAFLAAENLNFKTMQGGDEAEVAGGPEKAPAA